MTLPIGDKPVNRQSGYEAQRKREKPLGWHVLGKITRAILAREERGQPSYWDHQR